MEKVKAMINGQWLMVKKWIKKNPKEFRILVAILLVGAFFRLYKIDEYMTFLGDEGRDVIVVRRLLVDFDPILIGPRTSIGDMYLGPLYYYLMAPALLLAGFNPVGPAIMIALLGVATVFLVWFISKEWFGKRAAIISSLLYATSPVVITYSHSSWNPNIMPFFALLTIYSIWKIWVEKKYKWLLVTGVSMAFILQSHYLGLLLAPTLGAFWFLAFLKSWKGQSTRKRFLSYTLLATIIFLFLMSPLVIFDARHGWRNFASMRKFFAERQTTVSARPWTAIPKMWPIFRDDFVTRIVAGKNLLAGKVASSTLLVGTIVLFIANFKKVVSLLFTRRFKKKKESNFVAGFLITGTWLIVGLLGMGLYKQHVYDHYFGFMFAAPFLLIGVVSSKIFKKLGDDGKIFVVAGVLLLVVTNLLDNPLRYEPNFQLKRAVEVAKKIRKEAGDEQFNLAVIAERNYEDGYQYFLEKDKVGVVDIDAQRPETVMNQLFVVCEMAEKKCDPVHSPKAEVANFGWSAIENKWKVMEVTVYKLVHSVKTE